MITYSQSEANSLSPDQLKLAERAAMDGDLRQMKLVHNHYAFGEYDAVKERFWLSECAKEGDPASQFNLGKQLIDEGRKQAGVKFIRLSAAQNYQPAKEYLYPKGSSPTH